MSYYCSNGLSRGIFSQYLLSGDIFTAIIFDQVRDGTCGGHVPISGSAAAAAASDTSGRRVDRKLAALPRFSTLQVDLQRHTTNTFFFHMRLDGCFCTILFIDHISNFSRSSHCQKAAWHKQHHGYLVSFLFPSPALRSHISLRQTGLFWATALFTSKRILLLFTTDAHYSKYLGLGILHSF